MQVRTQFPLIFHWPCQRWRWPWPALTAEVQTLFPGIPHMENNFCSFQDGPILFQLASLWITVARIRFIPCPRSTEGLGRESLYQLFSAFIVGGQFCQQGGRRRDGDGYWTRNSGYRCLLVGTVTCLLWRVVPSMLPASTPVSVYLLGHNFLGDSLLLCQFFQCPSTTPVQCQNKRGNFNDLMSLPKQS